MHTKKHASDFIVQYVNIIHIRHIIQKKTFQQWGVKKYGMYHGYVNKHIYTFLLSYKILVG